MYANENRTDIKRVCLQVADKGPIGLTQHPHRNLLATWADEGALKLWKA